MRRPTTGTGKNGNGRGQPPPPEAEEPTIEELLDTPMAELIDDAMRNLRRPSGDPGADNRRMLTLLDAMQQKLSATNDPALLTPIEKLSKDLKEASRVLGKNEARFLVDAYYKMQEDRIRSAHQVRSLQHEDDGHAPEPHDVIAWLFSQEDQLERQIRTALDYYSGSDMAGVWARSIKGIGPVISAGLLANIEIEKAPTVGHIWRHAGLDPTSAWLGAEKAKTLVAEVIREFGEAAMLRRNEMSDEAIYAVADKLNVRFETFLHRLSDWDTGEVDRSRTNVERMVAKRPWNAGLKRLCYLIGESFVKVSNRPDEQYGKIYKARKEWETERNNRGLYAEQAKRALEEKHYGADTEARKHYEAGRLPPARIHLRASRRAVKLFLAHFHEVLFWVQYEQLPPHPWVLEHVPGHVHRIEVPNLELLPDLQEAKERAAKGPRPRRP